MKTKEVYVCKICGYINKYPFWSDNGGPTWEICPCCGSESGYDDVTVEAIKRNRKKWLSSQIKWFDECKRPKDWDFIEQIKNIPSEYL